jgi:hypothetical protein
VKHPFLYVAIIISLIGCGCAGNQGLKTVQAPAAAKPSLPERIAKQFADASPMADPSDARARDDASAKLARCRDFITATGERVLWGGCDPVKGFDPKTYTLTEFDPLVWLKLYASTIMFTGEHEVRKEGPYTVLEMKAKFRSNLDPGDYPYPFWHSPKKWQAYLDLVSLCVVFEGDQIVATYRITKSDPAKPPVAREWDGKWHWTNADGKEQPRVALFSYLFAADNPHRTSVDEAYRQLEARFRAQNCTSCHAPDNAGKAKELLLLNFPNQSLAGRHKLVEMLAEKRMPPADTDNIHPAGIADDVVRTELIQLAQTFVKEADAAVAFESSRQAATPDLDRK